MAHTSTLIGGGACITPGHARGRSDLSKPITMVQCGSPGEEERWHSTLQETLESMAGLSHFSSMDFKSGFWQIKMAPESQQYTAFTVGNLRFYKLTHMLFGLCNAPVTFQHLMQNTLGKLNLMYCMIYLDDVIIFGRTKEEHLECLRIVFKRFWEFNLKLKPSKCSFSQSKIIYLAHHVSQWGILLSHNNVQAVEEFPMPETYTQVCAFCGLAGHYWRFLVFPDFDKPFLLETDASKEGLGAVLSQKQGDGCYHQVTFGSCSLTPSEKNYHSS